MIIHRDGVLESGVCGNPRGGLRSRSTAPALAQQREGSREEHGHDDGVAFRPVVHVQGVVQSVSASAVVVRQLDGSAVSAAIDRRTKITIDGRPGKVGDVKPGFVLVTTVKAGQPASTLRFLRP